MTVVSLELVSHLPLLDGAPKLTHRTPASRVRALVSWVGTFQSLESLRKGLLSLDPCHQVLPQTPSALRHPLPTDICAGTGVGSLAWGVCGS